ncbi:MAG TPA: Rv3235 family protein [Arachnia sp.]|mgnify:CR=1 FL=1|nr:Rv3235 family protein [Arachnia sp.]
MFTSLHPNPASVSSAPVAPTDSAPPPAIALIAALVETLAGRRPLHQLRPHLSREAFLTVVAYADSGSFRRTMAAGLRTQMPSDGAVEASLRLLATSRWVSCVLRLDRCGRAWRCTEVSVLAPAALRIA